MLLAINIIATAHSRIEKITDSSPAMEVHTLEGEEEEDLEDEMNFVVESQYQPCL